MLSLKHYVAWVNSHGTVKAYSLHAKVLGEASGTEILSLYLVQKLAIELTCQDQPSREPEAAQVW